MQFPLVWKYCGNPPPAIGGLYRFGRSGSMPQTAPRLNLRHVNVCSRSIVFSDCTRGGILPKRNARGKRKLQEVMLHASHRIHSFSTAQFSSCVRRDFVNTASFRHFLKYEQASAPPKMRFPQGRPSEQYCEKLMRASLFLQDERRMTSFCPRNRGGNSGVRSNARGRWIRRRR